MKLLIQRVKEASVTVNKKHISTINEGLLILVGIHHNDTEDQIKKCVKKAIELRIFNDHIHQMTVSCKDLQKDILVVSQFTLYGDCSKGRRPNYSLAAKPEKAKVLYDALLKEFEHQLDYFHCQHKGAPVVLHYLKNSYFNLTTCDFNNNNIS